MRPRKGSYAEIPLVNGSCAIVDKKDFKWLSQWQWRLQKHKRSAYAVRREGDRTIYMHREIMQAPPGLEVDHISGNGQDNRRGNLRLATRGENRQHQVAKQAECSAAYIGVTRLNTEKYPNRAGKPFIAYITANRKRIHLGYFETAETAAIERDRAAIKHFGDFANLNFPDRFFTFPENQHYQELKVIVNEAL